MCGFFGIAYKDGQTVPEISKLKIAAELLHHRGPDGSGVHAEAGFGVAHTRLALVDLTERSQQPFWCATGRFCLVYNGEIYNFRELRKGLEERQVIFRTNSDTEVLLHCLIVYGPENTLAQLEGMFAFALYDKQERSLLLARDRFGIKPLSFYHGNGSFMFASEVKAMRPWIEAKPDMHTVAAFLLGNYGPAAGSSFYEGVRTLPPGSLVKLRIGEEPVTVRYMTLTDMLDPNCAEELRRLSLIQTVDLVDDLLLKSVRQMMFADADVGALCSGGVDSSLLMVMAARVQKNLAIFHANVEGPDSEYEAAITLARYLKLDLKKVDVCDQDFIDLMPDVIAHNEYPFFRHPHSVPFLKVARLVRVHGVKGILTGEGADECFMGYPESVIKPFTNAIERLAEFVRRTPKIGNYLAPRDDIAARHVADMLGHFERSLESTRIRTTYADVMGRPAGVNFETLDLLSYHLRTLLHRNDTMGMAASIEARFPYLSEDLVKIAINLPYIRKVRFSPAVWERQHRLLRDKWVLRQVADRYLPKTLSRRKKLPFTVTAPQRLKVPDAYFDKSFIADCFELTKSEVSYLLGKANQKLRVRLLMLDVWGRICIDGVQLEAMRARLRAHLSFGNAGA